MKTIFFSILLMLLSLTFLHAQEIPVIKAIQDSDSNYMDYEDYAGPNEPIGDLVFLKGCSWYCGGYVEEITASSELRSNGSNTYLGKNAHDFEMKTAWVEGKKDYGIGEYVEYKFNFDRYENYDGHLGITKILLANGYKKSKELWKANSRVKKLRMYVNNEPYAILEIIDSFEIQTIDIGKFMFPPKTTTLIKFEIMEVYPGSKYKDVAISELVFEGVGVH
ncbi:MAG: hypothetical protein OEV42_03425 [Deltaproteobacteria bacterium]|nr:hypothetical protein [Deltaproteobacteria bacterium]